MRFLLRKQLSPNQEGGDSLDSPTGGGTSTIDMPDLPDDKDTDKTGDNKESDKTTTVDTGKTTSIIDPLPENKETGKTDDKEEEENEVHPFQVIGERLGIEIAPEELTDDVEGMITIFQKGIDAERVNIRQEVENNIKELSPLAVELIRWKELNPTKSDEEFIVARMQAPVLDPEAIDKDAVETHKDIIYKNFVKQGLGEATAKRYAQMAVDANTSYEDAKEIVKYNNAQSEKQRADAEAEAVRVQQEAHAERVRDITAQIDHVKKGVLNGITIPQTEVENFINANFMDAGNPQFKGMAEVDIKIAQMNAEQRNFLRYLVHKDFDFKGLVEARATTARMSDFFKSKATGNKMSGGAARQTTGSNEDRSLDSPGS